MPLSAVSCCFFDDAAMTAVDIVAVAVAVDVAVILAAVLAICKVSVNVVGFVVF